MKRIKILLALLGIFSLLIPSSGFTHSGRTDENGGHLNRRTGEYHYHSGGTTQSDDSDQNMESTQTWNTDSQNDQKESVAKDRLQWNPN